MCGIFGVINYGGRLTMSELTEFKKLLEELLRASESRGRDASGICVVSDNRALIYKNNTSGGSLPNEPGYKKLMDSIRYDNNINYAFGHTRLPTKGSEDINTNNHPIVVDKIIGVHNGNISNDDALFDMYPGLVRKGEVDSEIIFQLLNRHMKDSPVIEEAVKATYKEIIGCAHVAFIHTDYKQYLTLFTGGDIHIAHNNFRKIMMFASTSLILKSVMRKSSLFNGYSDTIEIKYGSACRINTSNGKVHLFNLEHRIPGHTSQYAGH
jgi:glucosamine 6-phosphate synthetase-like amidotransferase/phosphosugar isomerase protein